MKEIIPMDRSENRLDLIITSNCACSVKYVPLRTSVEFQLWITATNAYEPLFNCVSNEVSLVTVELTEIDPDEKSLSND